MAGLPRAFGPDVTDSIMRFAVGYPRDRLRDIVNAIERIEHHNDSSSLLEWRYNGTHRPGLMVAISHRGRHNSFSRWELRDEDRAKYYGEFCESCGQKNRKYNTLNSDLQLLLRRR